jgi:ubiquinone biosynthesis protein UbiJ
VLLAREPWAQDRLGRHAGKTLKFELGNLAVGLTIDAQGRVGPADPAIVPDTTLAVPAARLPELPRALRASDPEQIAGLMHIQGDAALAHVVSDLARDLRWDVENDLARVFGDVAARRMMQVLKGLATGARQGAARMTENVGEYLVEEGSVLLGRTDYDAWAGAVAAAHRRLDALDARIGAMGGH